MACVIPRYSANWLQGFSPAEPGRPPLPFETVARILALPGAPGPDGYGGVIGAGVSAVTTAPFSELFLDGIGQGVLPTPRNSRGEIQPTTWPTTLLSGGSSGGSCTGEASFPINASGVQCHGLHQTHSGDTSASACANACCADDTCDTWQLETSAGDVCWTGIAGEGAGGCGPPRKGVWVGGQRHTAPAPPPTPPAPPFRNATLVAYSAHSSSTRMHGKASYSGGLQYQEVADADPTAAAGISSVASMKVLATHSLFAPSSDPGGYRLHVTVDVPSASTGTGTALLLDGRDTAMVRCAIVDSAANNALVSTASNRITWTVSQGPARLAGTSSGNTTSHEWMKSQSVNAYLGLARGMFRVTQDCTSAGRASCADIDADAGRAPTAVKLSGCSTAPIVIQASSAGFAPVRISIPVSTDPSKDGVMVVARATGTHFADGFSYLKDFVG